MQAEPPLEPATWPLAQQPEQASWLDEATPRPPPQFAPTTQTRLRSVSSQQEAIIRFVNDSELPVRAVWLDFAGKEVQYTVIEPKAQRRYKTFVTHPWIIRELATGQRMMLGECMVTFGKPGVTVEAVIKTPPPLKWSLATHKFFPEEFKSLVKTLLLAHNRVWRSDNAWVLLQEQHMGTHYSPLAQGAQEQHRAPALSKGGGPLLEGDPMECEPLLPQNTNLHPANHESVPVDPMYICLDAFCGSRCLPSPHLAHQSTTSTSLDSGSTCSAATCAPSSSWTAVDGSQQGSSRSPSPSDAAHSMDLSRSSMQQQQRHHHQYQQAAPTAFVTHPAPQQQPIVHQKQEQQQQMLNESNAALQHQYHQQQHHQHQQQLLLHSPCSVGRAAKVLGWVVDKVTKVARPMCMPRTPVLIAQERQGPFWRDTLPEMSELPTHLVLHIISFMAPTDVPQCVSRGSPLAYPDILPALLESDPASWPPPPPAPAAEADQPTQ